MYVTLKWNCLGIFSYFENRKFFLSLVKGIFFSRFFVNFKSEWSQYDLNKIWNSKTKTVKKFLNPFCFACTLVLLPLHKAKWVQLMAKHCIAGSKNFFTKTVHKLFRQIILAFLEIQFSISKSKNFLPPLSLKILWKDWIFYIFNRFSK